VPTEEEGFTAPFKTLFPAGPGVPTMLANNDCLVIRFVVPFWKIRNKSEDAEVVASGS
jgi:hypothetical protein